MVIESAPLALTSAEKRRRRAALIRRHGLLRTVNKLAYNWVRSRFLQSRGTEDQAVVALFPDRDVRYRRSVPTIEVPNINDAACIEFVRSLAPDMLAVCGTTVIRAAVFSLARVGTLNIHTGITPEYRSADPIFWALYEGKPDKVGVTIHLVDAGIDTGPIVRQEVVPVFRVDTLSSIYLRCIRRGAELYLGVLADAERGTLSRQAPKKAPSRAFYSIDLGIVQYLVFLWRFSRLKRRLPAGPDELDRSLA